MKNIVNKRPSPLHTGVRIPERDNDGRVVMDIGDGKSRPEPTFKTQAEVLAIGDNLYHDEDAAFIMANRGVKVWEKEGWVEVKDAPTADKAAPTSDKDAPTADKAAPTSDKAAPTADKAAPTAPTK